MHKDSNGYFTFYIFFYSERGTIAFIRLFQDNSSTSEVIISWNLQPFLSEFCQLILKSPYEVLHLLLFHLKPLYTHQNFLSRLSLSFVECASISLIPTLWFDTKSWYLSVSNFVSRI